MLSKVIAKIIVPIVLLLSVIVLSGCGYSNVGPEADQGRASQMADILNRFGIYALVEKASGGKAKYQVLVRSNYYSQALAILNENGFLKAPEPSLDDLLAQQGFLPSSREIEMLRVYRAMSLQLEELLNNHPAVARAKIMIPPELGAAQGPVGLSVVIREKPGQKVVQQEIREIISKAFARVPIESISVQVFSHIDFDTTAHSGVLNKQGAKLSVPLGSFLYFWQFPEQERKSFTLALAVALIIVFALGMLIGYWRGLFTKEYAELPTDNGVDKLKGFDEQDLID